MSTAPLRDLAPENEPNGGPSSEYARLRELIVGPEKSRLEELQRRLDNRQLRTEELSQVVAEAIALRSRRDRALQQSLNPLVEEAVRISVTRNPGILANALYPVIGEAVRKAVAHALRGLVESINLTLERSVSLEALQWRFEALRTGRPFAEIVLTRSLRYRVEQVFLIHRETGLLLQHVARSDQIVQDSDLVSGMLTAIQDFIRDSFAGTTGRDIETIELDEFNLWVQHGPAAILAAVVSGAPPPELRNVLARTLEQVHAEYGPALASFNGDSAAFAATRPLLDACLLGRQEQKSVRQSKPFFIASAAVLLAAIAIVTFVSARAQKRWERLQERLRHEPGIMLTSASRSWGAYELIGLRDPLSTDPEKIVRASGIDPARVTARWEPYVSLDAKFSLFRQFLGEKDALEQTVLRFPLNSVQLSGEQLAKLDDIEAHIVKLQHEGGAVGQKFVIEVYGHTDPTGNEDRNDALSKQRADEVANALVSRGIGREIMRTVAMGSREPVRAAYLTELNRRVTFHVVIDNEAGR